MKLIFKTFICFALVALFGLSIAPQAVAQAPDSKPTYPIDISMANYNNIDKVIGDELHLTPDADTNGLLQQVRMCGIFPFDYPCRW